MSVCTVSCGDIRLEFDVRVEPIYWLELDKNMDINRGALFWFRIEYLIVRGSVRVIDISETYFWSLHI